MTSLIDLAAEESHELIKLRRDFHSHPELSYKEERTAQVIGEYLEALGLSVCRPQGMTGMWADLKTEGATKTLCFRADMDALAMDEVTTKTKEGFLSQNKGAAHCCGHDSHMAILMTAASLLASGKAERKHNLRFLFQHAEETPPGGAIDLIAAGCLEGVDEIYGLHVIPPLPGGMFNVLAGPFMAAADNFTITVRGKGGHAAMPHLIIDPIVAAAQVIVSLQQLVSRRSSPFEPFVVSVSTIQGGSGTTNVIPDSVFLKGTVRCLSKELHEKAPVWIREVAEASARASACAAEVVFERGYPLLVNDEGATENARAAVLEVFGPRALIPEPFPLMGGEDFARYAEERPASYVFLGVGSDVKGITAPNHATDFDVDEETLHYGTAWFLGLARRER